MKTNLFLRHNPPSGIQVIIYKIIFLIFTQFCFFLNDASAQVDKNIKPVVLKFNTISVSAGDSLQYIILKEKYIVTDSISVSRNGKIQRQGPDYVYNADTKILFFKNPEKESEYTVRYAYIPLEFPQEFFRRKEQRVLPETAADTSDAGANIIVIPKDPMFEDVQINRSGNLVRGVTIGSGRDMSLNSGFRMELNGKLGKDLDLLASLTDQTSPLQPEGTTQNIREIDKIFIQLTHPVFQSTFGDFYLQNSETVFGKFNRKMEGGMVSLKHGGHELKSFISSTEGEYFSNKFTGLEGNQGPYQLIGKENEKDIIVIGGTEKIWIDGIIMKRGESNDYVIDYSLGQVTFTKNRIITADSRIEVDFEYSNRVFKRTLFGMNQKGSFFNNKARYSFSFVSESDGKDNPVEFDFSEEEKLLLRSVGDSLEKTFYPGEVYVGEGKGRYVIVDSMGISFFRYVGENQGDYLVRFSYSGQNSGSYKLDSFGVYSWTGENNGSYLPVVKVPVPVKHTLGDLKIELAPHENISLNLEYALSGYDQNTFSSINDKDNSNSAYTAQLSARSGKNKYGDFSFTGDYYHRDEDFRDFGRTREVEFDRKWYLEEDIEGSENRYEITGNWKYKQDIRFSAIAGSYKRGENFNSNRSEMQFSLNRGRLKSWDYNFENIKSTVSGNVNTWQRHKGNAFIKLWKFEPGIRFESENKQPEKSSSLSEKSGSLYNGLKFSDINGIINFPGSRKIKLYGIYGLRKDWEYQAGEEIFISDAFTGRLRLDFNPVRQLTGQVNVISRSRKYEDNRGSVKTDLAGTQLRYTPVSKVFDIQWDFRISKERTPKTERVYIEVEEGKGNYTYIPELGDYVPDSYGNYILRILPTDDYVPTNEISNGFRLRFSGTRLFSKKKVTSGVNSLLRGLEAKTLLKADDKNTGKSHSIFHFINWTNLLKTGSTFTGRIHFRQDLSYSSPGRDYVLRGWYNYIHSMNNQYIDRRENNFYKEMVLKSEQKITRRWRYNIDLIKKGIEKNILPNSQLSRNIISYQVNTSIIWQSGHNLEISFEGSGGRDKNTGGTEIKAVYFGIKPGFRRAFLGKGRLQGNLHYVSVKTDPGNVVLPYEMANGNRNGNTFRWLLNFNYNISRSIIADFNYNGEKRRDSDRIFQTARIEVRALF